MQNEPQAESLDRQVSPARVRWLWIAFGLWQMLPIWLVLFDFAIGIPSYVDSAHADKQFNTLQYNRGMLVVGAVAIVFTQIFLLTGKILCETKHRVFSTLMTICAAVSFYQGCSYFIPYRFPERYREEESAYQHFFYQLMTEPYLMMPLLSLMVVLIIARLFRWQVVCEQRRPTPTNSFQFTMRELIVALLLAPILFPTLRIWLGQLQLPVSFDELVERTFGTRSYRQYNLAYPNGVDPNSWSFSSLFLIDWICFILKCSLIVVPLLYLRRKTPKWVWGVLVVGVAIGQLALDRVSIHHEFLFRLSPVDHFPFWIFSPIQVLFIFVSWYLLTQLGYQFTRLPKALPAESEAA